MKILKTVSVSALSIVLAYGCSSSGGGGSSDTTPNGIYTGTITGGDVSSNGTEQKAVIYNNRMMILSNQATGVSQLFDAALSDSANTLASTGERYDSNGTKINNITYSGTFVAGESASVDFIEMTTGTATLAPGSFALTEDTAAYDKGSDLSRLSGTWSGIFVANSNATMTLMIDASGVIQATSGDSGDGADCNFTGSFSIIDAAINVYSLSLISDGGTSGCFVSANTYTGLAWTEGDTNNTLVLMAADGNRGRAAVLTKN